MENKNYIKLLKLVKFLLSRQKIQAQNMNKIKEVKKKDYLIKKSKFGQRAIFGCFR